MGAHGVDAYSLLSVIGRDCVGALQFIPEEEAAPTGFALDGEEMEDADIAQLITNLAQTPLGLDRADDFRISVAGAQEKTALLHNKGKWFRPTGSTPTTQIFKPQIGRLPNGVDLSESVENEYLCLKLLAAFGRKRISPIIKLLNASQS